MGGGGRSRDEDEKKGTVRAARGCIRDEGRPLQVGLQEQTSNYFKLPASRALVMSVKEKAP